MDSIFYPQKCERVKHSNPYQFPFLNKSGLAIEAMRHWSQGSSQSPIRIVKKEAFWRHFGGLLKFFVWMVAEVF
jgi:hypothetical protein